ncbi:MAG: hypothetical protein EAZ76_12820 [Nostocales cyanobacterium]|nr:MAG: hypothetical protein EAZ87_13850 [Nostocales cyanobacterium]TAF12949.1 MAG: hypothetical protein EAZ76_12820 [Nostocales cyanobacterium]
MSHLLGKNSVLISVSLITTLLVSINETDSVKAEVNQPLIAQKQGEVWSYGLGLAMPDLGKKGNVLGFFVGAQPYLSNNNSDKPYHVEGFYKYRLSDNISITPGIIWLTNPGQSSDNDDAVIGTFRTTFNF